MARGLSSGSESPSDNEEACREVEIQSDRPTGGRPQQDTSRSELGVTKDQNSVSNLHAQPHTKGDGGRDEKVTVGINSDSIAGDSGGNAVVSGDATGMHTDACNTSPGKYANRNDDEYEDQNLELDLNKGHNKGQDKDQGPDLEREADADSEAEAGAVSEAEAEAGAEAGAEAQAQADADAQLALNELDRVYLGVHILRTLSLQITHQEQNRFLVQQYVDTAGKWAADASKQKWFQTLVQATSFLHESKHSDKPRGNKRKYSIFTQYADARHVDSKCKSVKREREMQTPNHQNGGLRQEDCAGQSDVVRSNNTNRRYGSVVQWYEKKGFGFVSEEDCENSIFLHISNVTTGQRSLVSGQLLSYDEYFDKRNNKYTAVNASIRNNMATTVYSLRVQQSPRSRVHASHTPNKRYCHDERGHASNNNTLPETEFHRPGFAVSPRATLFSPRYAPLADMPWQFVEDHMYDKDNTYRPPPQGNSRDAYARHEQHNNLKAHGIVCTLLLLILSMHMSVHCSILQFFQFLTTPTKPHCVNRTAV